LHLPLELPHEQGKIQRLWHARPRGPAVAGQRDNRLIQLLHRQGRLHLHPNHRRIVAGVGEPMVGPWRDHQFVTRGGEDAPQARSEPHGAGQHVEALLLLGVDMASRHVAVGSQDQVEGQQPTIGLAGGLPEDEPLAADWIVENLPTERHGPLPWSSGRRPARVLSVMRHGRGGRVIGRRLVGGFLAAPHGDQAPTRLPPWASPGRRSLRPGTDRPGRHAWEIGEGG
jgi:hypothetical protein